LADPRLHTADFEFYYRATRLWAQGVDPYTMRPVGFFEQWPLWDRLFYPLPALILTGPFALFPARMAQTLFVATASGLLAWRLSRDALWPLLLFCTPSFLVAAWLGQWSPWLVLGALVPSAGFLLAAKPTLGLACWLYRPTWRHVATGAGIVVASLVLMPHWPVAWLDNLRAVQQHAPPILTPYGFVLALAVLRWRDPDARFLVAMSCVPQLGYFADQLPLLLIAKSRREIAFLALAGWVAFLPWLLRMIGGGEYAPPYAMLGCYGPALYLVLCRRTSA
jgi:hypothetical protein